MQRRDFLKFSLGTAALAALPSRVSAQTGVKEIRVGYQKNGVLVITRQQAALEKHFATQGIEVKWVEFSSGSPLGLIPKPIAIRDIVWRNTQT
jgi:sulfonate transport system substrate-binding protein